MALTITQIQDQIDTYEAKRLRLQALADRRAICDGQRADLEGIEEMLYMLHLELDKLERDAAQEAQAPAEPATTAQADYITTLRDEAPATSVQVTPDALALHLRERDARAAGIAARDASGGDRKAQRAAKRTILDTPHTEWLDRATEMLVADRAAWQHALTAELSTLTKDQASQIIDLLKHHCPATEAHPTQQVHHEMPGWGTVLLHPERVN